MIRELPPLNAFKVFETAARSKSFARAAAELSVNGYISNQWELCIKTRTGHPARAAMIN